MKIHNAQLPSTGIDWAKAKAAGALGITHSASARAVLLRECGGCA